MVQDQLNKSSPVLTLQGQQYNVPPLPPTTHLQCLHNPTCTHTHLHNHMHIHTALGLGCAHSDAACCWWYKSQICTLINRPRLVVAHRRGLLLASGTYGYWTTTTVSGLCYCTQYSVLLASSCQYTLFCWHVAGSAVMDNLLCQPQQLCILLTVPVCSDATV